MAGRSIVVGWDGSEVADAAVRWAFQHARHAGDRVEVLLAWDLLTQPGDFDPAFDQAAATRCVTEAVARLRPPELDPGLVHARAVLGQPAGVLLDASRDADLVVLGRTGSGGVAAALVGSVSHALLRRASCAVVVVPE